MRINNGWLSGFFKFYASMEIRPYTAEELAELYSVSDEILNCMLAPFNEELGPLAGGYYNVLQVQRIIELIGLPYRLKAGY